MATRTDRNLANAVHERPQGDWHALLDQLTNAYVGASATIEVLDEEFGDEYEAERMPLAYIEYDEHADVASVAVGGRDGRYPVVLRHGIDHPSSIRTDTQEPDLPLAVEIVGGDGSRTLVSVFPPPYTASSTEGGRSR
jgi:hypothetical protein